MKKILILGNGFDLDLGLKSRYSDFMNSGIWKNAKKNIDILRYSILAFLEEKNKLESWFDVEAELLNYALEITEGTYRSPQDSDKEGFELYQAKLKEYLQKQEDSYKTNTAPTALVVMNAVLANGFFSDIYTFNYTNVQKLLSRYFVPFTVRTTYMHGSLRNSDNIILGIETEKKIHHSYQFLFKTNSRFYAYNNLIDGMNEADEIVFFGHSINGMDFPYFKDFFMKQSRPSEDFTRKTITIFTYDDDSQQAIKNNFREAGISLRELMSRNDLTFIETKRLRDGDEHEEEKLDLFLSHLEHDSRATEEANLNRLAQMLP